MELVEIKLKPKTCLLVPDSPHLHRKGGSVDERLLSSTFKSLGFQVQVEKNLSANEMISVLRKGTVQRHFQCSEWVIMPVFTQKYALVSNENHTNNSCFVCVLMSHGEEGKIFGSDECWIHVKTLTSLMTSDLCPSLRDKPKLFFLQVTAACKREREKHFRTFCLWLTNVLLV